MINKKDLIEKAENKQLNGAKIDILEFNYSNNTIKSCNEYQYYKYYDTDVKISKRFGNFDIINLDDDFVDVDYDIGMEKSGEVVNFACTNVTIHLKKHSYRAKPFQLFEMGIDDLNDTPMIGDGKSNCKVLDIGLNSVISFSEDSRDIYGDMISVAVNTDCYIHIINYIDGSLPTIMVFEYNLGDSFRRHIFKKSTDKIYNSYFHPHTYRKVSEKIYPNVVFGSPGGEVNNIINEKVEDRIYTNDDHIIGDCSTNRGIASVKFCDIMIAKYTMDDQNNIDNLFLVDYYKDLLNDDPDMTVTFKEISRNHDLPNMIATIDPETKFDSYISSDSGICYINKDDNKVNVIHMIDNITELFNVMTTDQGQTVKCYTITVDDNTMFISVTVDKDSKELCYYHTTANRAISISRDGNNIIYNKGSHWITTDKSNDIINTNLPISGSIIPYNIFGIPVDF